MYLAKAYAAESPTSPLEPKSISRRDLTGRDVQIEILFCGICHSDLHTVRDEWHAVMPTVYPAVPGHEIVGRVTRVGSFVTAFREGDLVGVGCLVDSVDILPSLSLRSPQKRKGRGFLPANSPAFNGDGSGA